MKRLNFAIAMCLLSGGLLSAQEISFEGNINFLKLPSNIYMGEAAGVATDARGHIFVYTRTGGENVTMGGSRFFTHGGSRLFEFDATGKYVKEIGTGIYGFLFAQSVRVDPQGLHLDGGPGRRQSDQVRPRRPFSAGAEPQAGIG